MSRETNTAELLIDHVRYELDMLFGTYDRLREPIRDDVVRNALIESFCVHARALIDFFMNEQGLPASEFTDAEYEPLRPIAVGINGATAQKLNTQIAHLTKKRVVDPREKIGPEDRSQLLEGLSKALRQFESHLKEPYRGLWQRYPELLGQLLIETGPTATNSIEMASSSAFSTTAVTSATSVTISSRMFVREPDKKE